MMNIKFDENGFAESDGIALLYTADQNREYAGQVETNISAGTSLPPGAYLDEPPAEKEGKAVMRSEDGTKWVIVADYRGQTAYATDNSGPVEIKEPGEIPDGYTLLTPATAYDNWNGAKWVTDKDAQKLGLIAEAEAQKSALIDEANAFITEQNWQSKLLLGRLKDSDKAQFNRWLDYIDAVTDTDTSSPASVQFPAKPTS